MAKAQSNDLGRILIELSKDSSNQDTIKQLLNVLHTPANKEFIKKLNSQSIKTFLRQLLKMSADYFASPDAVTKALENGVIYDDIANYVIENFNDITTANFASKNDVMKKWVTSQSEAMGLSRIIGKALETFNNHVLTKTENLRTYTNSLMFSLGNLVPEHRLDELIFKLAKFNFFVLGNSDIKVERTGPNGNIVSVSAEKGIISAYDAEKIGLCVDVNVFNENDKTTVSLDVKYKGVTATDVSIQFDKEATSKSIIEHLQNMYIVNSRVLVTKDFKTETEYLSTLFIEPLENLLSQTYDDQCLGFISTLRNVKSTLRAEFLKISKNSENKYKNPFLYAFLSIVEEGSNPTLNDGETIGRIATTDVVAKLFQGIGDKYNNLIQPMTPVQVPLDRRFSIFRAEFGDDVIIDFLIAEYGIEKKVVWAPLDKACILPGQFVTSWELMKMTTNSFNRRAAGDEEKGEAYKAIDSRHFNPKID